MPPLKLDLPPPVWEQAFEDLCCDLWRLLWNNRTAEKYGRRGQAQKGVDIYGWSARDRQWEAVQCKLKGLGHRLERKDIEADVTRAQEFEPRLGRLWVATTARRDVATQDMARALSIESESKGWFPITVFAWDDIVDELNKHQDLLWLYYCEILAMKPTDDPESPIAVLAEQASGAADLPLLVGAPRSEAGLGSDELREGISDRIAKARLAVDRQDDAALEEVLHLPFEEADPGPRAELDLYGSLLAAHQGDSAEVRARLLRSGRAASPEARLRTTFGLLQQGYVADASLLMELEEPGASPALHVLAEAVRIWIGAASPVSTGSQVSLERLDALALEAQNLAAPATLWLCFARLALKLGDPGRADRWLERVDHAARASVDFLHVAALTAIRGVTIRRLENPHRALPENDRGRLVQASVWLHDACLAAEKQSADIRSDLVHDLATAHELLAGVLEGSARASQLVAAAEAYQRAAAADPGMERSWARAGRCWLVAGHSRQALQAYQNVREDLLDSMQRSDLAAAQLLQGLPEAAMETIARILHQDLAPWQALFNAAIVLHLAGHSETAARALEQARARAGRSSWRVETLRGIVYGSMGDAESAEDAYREAIYARGTLDLQLHQAFSAVFRMGSERQLRGILAKFRQDFRKLHAKTDSLDDLEKKLESAVAIYSQRIEDLAKNGSKPSALLMEALQEAFEALSSLHRTLRRLQEVDGSRERWPEEILIDSVGTIASGVSASGARRTAGKPFLPSDNSGFDWRSLHARARTILAELPAATTLMLQDPALLEGLCHVGASESEARAHRLAIAARIFEINTSTVLRCYQSLSGENGSGSVLHKVYQERAIKRVFNRMQGRAILADDVGLGKTIEAGLILTEYRLRRLVRRCLVLVPTSDLALQWHRELESKLGHQPPHSWQVGRYRPRRHQDWTRFDTWIATYQAAVRHRAEYLAADWDLVIADEAHHLTDRSSEWYKLVKKFRCSHLLLLTATPVHRSVDDLFSLVSILRPGHFGSLRAFRAFFSDEALADDAQRGTVVRLLSQVMIRNTLLAVADQVFTGRRVFKNVPVQLNEYESSFYEKVTNLVLTLGKVTRRGRLPMEYYAIAKMASSSAKATFSAVNRMATRPGRSLRESRLIRRGYDELAPLLATLGTPAKTLVVEKILQEIAPRKALIFVEFRETALQLAERLGIPALHSRLDQDRRTALITAFERSEEQRAIVASRGLAEGLNLAFCSVLINYDLPWNPMRIEQRIGRIQRIGQHHPEVLIYSLAASGTIEEEIRDALMRKVDLFQRVVGEIGLDLASVTDGRAITARLRAILREAVSLADLRLRVRRFFAEVMPPSVSEDPL